VAVLRRNQCCARREHGAQRPDHIISRETGHAQGTLMTCVDSISDCCWEWTSSRMAVDGHDGDHTFISSVILILFHVPTRSIALITLPNCLTKIHLNISVTKRPSVHLTCMLRRAKASCHFYDLAQRCSMSAVALATLRMSWQS
jgi:hypothetical protein